MDDFQKATNIPTRRCLKSSRSVDDRLDAVKVMYVIRRKNVRSRTIGDKAGGLIVPNANMGQRLEGRGS